MKLRVFGSLVLLFFSLVAEAGEKVQLCAGVTVDRDLLRYEADYDMSPLLQRCIDQTPVNGALVIPLGTYKLQKQLRITKPMRMEGSPQNASVFCKIGETRCPTFIAGAYLYDAGGMIHVETANFAIYQMILDGNRHGRVPTQVGVDCRNRNGNWTAGMVATFVGQNLKVHRSAFINAVCGTGLQVPYGPGLDVWGSYFVNNGDHGSLDGMVADGLTVGWGQGIVIRNTTFMDNSDINLILGHAPHGRIYDNYFGNRVQAAWASFMLDNFRSSTDGNFEDLWFYRNTIDCTANLCDIGVQLGPQPWYPSPNIFGGTITGNLITGAKIQINIAGAGINGSPVSVYNNNLYGTPPAGSFFKCGIQRTSPMNIVPTFSVVNRNGEAWGYTQSNLVNCY